jgi:hypothetical protein
MEPKDSLPSTDPKYSLKPEDYRPCTVRETPLEKDGMVYIVLTFENGDAFRFSLSAVEYKKLRNDPVDPQPTPVE